jgi:hypothetical protein
MRKLEAVEIARQLMTEGQTWSVWRWLLEKSRVREAADRATEALAEENQRVKSTWSDALQKSYAELIAADALASSSRNRKKFEKARDEAAAVDAAIKAEAKRVKEADEDAKQATDQAEEMFAEAERHMSGSMAREAAGKALESYDLREKAIRRAEAARRNAGAG